MKTQSVKKTQTEGNPEMRALETSNRSLRGKSHRQKNGERILGTEDTIEEMDNSVKENVKAEKLAQNIRGSWDTLKRSI